jgi:DNA invertase Pin-like site-specific DNA recombinase/DNA-binding transcriptional MerR regulator
MNADTSKVTADHLRRGAYLYIRQSTMYQVVHNTESTRRQYDLKGRAVTLGWHPEQVHVIDVDQGSSGTSAADRAGFQQLVGEVSLGRAGIVLGLECSRLARDNADWQALIKTCALHSTLICDEDGLYDPGSINDRMVLGMKGQISEFEIHYLQTRMRGGLLAKAARGELPMRLPIGLAYDPAGNVILDPDTGIRKAIAHLFTTFEQTGSASAVVKAFKAADLKFPARDTIGDRAGQLYWKPLRHDQVLFMLHNPRYAGAYAYGRRTHRVTGGRHTTTNKPRDQWTTLIPGAHPGYISWDQYEANQRQLAANAASRGPDRKAGPPREGPALLQGLVICGKCGKRMTVRYHTRRDGTPVPDYACQREGINTGTPPCQNMSGSTVDAAVTGLVIEALTPLAIESALQVTAQLHAHAEQADAIRATHVQRAQHAAEVARRRYLAVEPTNRLVADALEADWNTTLRELATAQHDYDRARQHDTATLSPEQTERIRALATDLPAIWNNPATSMKDRKRLIRQLVTDVTLLKTSDHITAHVRLSGGQTTTLTLPRPPTAYEQHTTPDHVLTLIDQLLHDHPLHETADILNQRGITGGRGRRYTTANLTALCRARNIPTHADRLRDTGMLTAEQTATQLATTIPTINTWHRLGLITGRRADRRGTHLFHPGQHRPTRTQIAAAKRPPQTTTLITGRQLAARLAVTNGTVLRWHKLGLIPAPATDHRGVNLYHPDQQRPTPHQITAAGRPPAHRNQELLTGGQLAAKLGVARSTIYKWYRLGLIPAVTVDRRGRHLYHPGQQPPPPNQITAARTAAPPPAAPGCTSGM